MKTYELVIEERQPTCGGRSPTRSTIKTITTDDPVAYVKALEKGEIEVSEHDGTLIIQTDHNGLWVKYEFTEE